MATTQHYLADALTQHLANGTVTAKVTQPNGCALPPQPPVSYATDIAPVLQAKCVVCHSPGNVGPFAMTSHEVVYGKRWEIREAVRTGHMPPWHADPEYGHFANDSSFKPADAAKLVQWIDEGALRGDGLDQVSSIGNCTFDGEEVVLVPAGQGQPFILKGTWRFVAADGATSLNAEAEGTGTPAPANPNFVNIRYDVKFTGGTGRMANARGKAKLEGVAMFTSPTSGTTTFVFAGEIFSRGDRDHEDKDSK